MTTLLGMVLGAYGCVLATLVVLGAGRLKPGDGDALWGVAVIGALVGALVGGFV